MPHARNRNPSPIPEVTWDTGLKEMNETWKGAIACLGVAIFFVMTIGIIYWQVVDQPNKNWILRGGFSGLIWERRTHSLVIQTLTEDKTFVEIDVGNVETSDTEVPFVRNLCWLNKTEFCYTWDSMADVKIALESDDTSDTECYTIVWTALHCQVDLKDCFSMANVSWYGGASLHAQSWPINGANTSMQPFTVSDLRENPAGYGSVLERYFLGSSGVAVLVDPAVPLQVGFESGTQFCLRAAPDMVRQPLHYTVCVGRDLRAVHQEVWSKLHPHRHTALPNLNILRLPFWKLLAKVDSGAKVERELRTFSNRLKRHRLGDGVISLNEHSTSLLSDTDHEYVSGRRRTSKRQARTLPMVRLLNLSVTLSPYLSVDSRQFQSSLQDGTEDYWLSVSTAPHRHPVPLLTQWEGKFCVKLNLSNPAAVSWILDRTEALQSRLDAEYVILEGGAGALSPERGPRLPRTAAGDQYIRLLASVAAKMGDSTVVTAGTRSSDVPLFIRMTPLRSDWTYSGLKGLIPSILHYSLMGYSFFLPDAVGGSLSGDFVSDEELFIRWLEIASFLPVITFHTPPWVCGEDRVLNLTRFYITKHQDFVVPLIVKYATQWQEDRSPVYRPLWWVSPDDPFTYTIDDQFLIGDEVLVAPVTERGVLQRDIYLPGDELQWLDARDGRVFDGGTLLEDYPVGLDEVPVFTRRDS